MKAALIRAFSLCETIALSMSLFLWSFVIILHIYSLIWTAMNRTEYSAPFLEDAGPNLFVAVIAAAFIKMSWDGLIGYSKIKQHSLKNHQVQARKNYSS